ncbi:MAG TPA: lamin tail domain-containing protein [Candidatus Paceibacterota bacterium]|nr:lamin tail domain-containing protein [Candidatus Paceibacterota bacterium]
MMKTKNLKKRILIFLVVGVMGFLLLPSAVFGFFSGSQISEENDFSSGTLDLGLSVDTSSAQSRQVSVFPDGNSQAFEYAMTVQASTTDVLCQNLQVEVKRNGSTLYPKGTLLNFSAPTASLNSDATDTLDFTFSVPNEHRSYSGDCTVQVIYQANQNGYPYGKAFYDQEIDTFVLHGADFGSSGESGEGNNVENRMVISEIMYDPDGNDTDREWVEVYNGSSTEIDLTAWKLEEGGTAHFIHSYNGSALVQPFTYAIIADDAKTFLDEYQVSAPVFDSSFTLPNSSDTLRLLNPAGDVIDTQSYPPPAGASDNGKSLQLNSSGKNMCVGTPTPGAQNICQGGEGKSKQDAALPVVVFASSSSTEISTTVSSTSTSDEAETSSELPDSPSQSTGTTTLPPKTAL